MKGFLNVFVCIVIDFFGVEEDVGWYMVSILIID